MKKFRDFESAREFVRSLKLKNSREWEQYVQSGNKPDDISAYPNKTYKTDYKGFGDWLGTGTVAHQLKYRPFQEAREFVRSLILKRRNDWLVYCKSGNKPDDIPSNPNTTYKNKGWIDMDDWLGSKNTEEWRPIKEAREFTRSLGLKNKKEWLEYCKSGNKPDDIPRNLGKYYENNFKNEFKGYDDWLDTGNIPSHLRTYRSFKKARKFIQKLGLKNKKEWLEYCKSGNKPDDIPRNPWDVYKE